MRKKIIILVIIIIILGAGFLIIKNKNLGKQAAANVRVVKMAEAELESLTTKVTADGNVFAKEEKGIKAPLEGIVKEVFVESGDLVKKGNGIYCFEDEFLKNSLETARLNYQEAEGNYETLLDKYNNQDKLNDLKLEESRRNLEIAVLSYQKEKADLEDQKLKLEKQFTEAEKTLEKAEENLEENEYLYKKDAIPHNTLKESRESYQQAERDYKSADNDLNLFLEKTMPNTLELAQLKIDNARSQLTYLEASMESERITKKDLDIAKIKISKAEKEIEEIEDNLDKVVTYALMDGTVINLDIKSGDKLEEGSKVGSIADLNSFIVKAMVDEIDVNEVNEGQSVIITSDSFDKDLEGEVTFLAPAGTEVGNLNKYKTEITVFEDMGLLRPGMFVNAEIITNRRDEVIAVPSLAVLGDKDKYVFVAEEGIAEKRPVKVGLKNLSKVEISNVQPGEKIIIGPYTILTGLKEGTPVVGANSGGSQDR